VTRPRVSWSPDVKVLYLQATSTRQTYLVPLRSGQLLPHLQPSGIGSMVAAAGFARGGDNLAAARLRPHPSAYMFPRVTTHRNIYRIRVL